MYIQKTKKIFIDFLTQPVSCVYNLTFDVVYKGNYISK